jgi:pimeloyl-ACP methyl ester carboxylesterase
MQRTAPQAARWHAVHWVSAVLGGALMLAGLVGLFASYAGLQIESTRVGTTPVSLFQAKAAPPGPVVVVAHGFAGSRQLMHPFAVTLARNGYRALVFDFPGHGRNTRPLAGEIGDDARAQALLSALSEVVEHARSLPEGDRPLALLGHSMAGDIATRYASGHQGVRALVAVSPYLSLPLDQLPTASLLFVYGAWEPKVIQEQGRSAVAAVAGIDAADVALDTTYGSFADGTARRLVIADGVEHIGVLYSTTALRAAQDWLDAAFNRPANGADTTPGGVDHRGPWLGLYYLGVLLLAWPLALRLPQVSAQRLGAGARDGWGWRRFWPIAVLPALLTPVLLWPMPTDFLAIAIGDYIALHFGLYGLLTLIGLWRADALPRLGPASFKALVMAIAVVAVLETLALSLPTDLFVASYLPAPHRLPTVAALLAGTLIWFIADEWLTRGPAAPRAAYALTKALFLVSLMLAVALNLNELFFLVIIIPAILVLFLVYGLFSGWIYRRTGQPLVAAVTNAFAFASAIAVSFPLVG